MDYSSIKIKYSYEIRGYVDRIASSMKITAFTTGSHTVQTSAYAQPGEETSRIIDECMKEFYMLLINDYPSELPFLISNVVTQIFEKDVIPAVKEANQKKMGQEMNKSYWGYFGEEIGSLIVFMLIMGTIFWIISLIAN